ncbi:N-acetylmuramoyl-L-alanine amidase [Psychrosphaera sp. F3M07]|jgi:N-acetylmuramoyl-L-alanine amidase|uniref:N-acetylmuramoyl-L-alanine amidase n=1 Tax=Psychrosphaera sp. F3M07 TaxID=2841560 RepID=UPI001C0A31EA|nr:N-acetylmuramoyl-L-alanine amidase [Psychrosphaera sp. F3M07]MBU2919433.1 N-acetylmuramoyl-L-alanine amidase [Psychrosphaera sp. F3M07]
MWLNSIIRIILINSLLAITIGFSMPAFAAKNVKNVRVWPSPDSTRVVLDLTQSIEYSYFMLSNPERLVLDLKNTSINAELSNLAQSSDILKNIRSSTKNKSDSRLVFDLTSKIEPIIFALKPTAPYGNRLVIDLVDTEAKVAENQKKMESDRDIIIAIDAGHGGEDPGSIGGKGNYEKRITLAISKKLEALINKQPGLTAVMTRTGDYYISVHGRTEKARNANADLLISIHADAYHTPHPSGAGVWTLSPRRANSEIGKWLEKKEKHSELLGGAGDAIKNTTTEKYLVRTLLDMSMDHSMSQGYLVAKEILGELKDITKLHKRSPQSASFGVLKSPDIPSILVETGFISNPKEEKLLINNWFQNKMANSIFTAVNSYFKRNPPDGSYFAKFKDVKHKVKRGESLSLVAQNYNVTVSKIKEANNLRSNNIKIGQVLSIPQS